MPPRIWTHRNAKDSYNQYMKRLLIIFLILLTTSCDWISKSKTDQNTKHPLRTVVHKLAQAYNTKNLDVYFTYFDQNVNVFSTNGLGTARTVNGLQDFKGYTKSTHKAKFIKLEILDGLIHEPWVFTKQKLFIDKNILVSVVGYRVEKDKVVDVMIVNEQKIK